MFEIIKIPDEKWVCPNGHPLRDFQGMVIEAFGEAFCPECGEKIRKEQRESESIICGKCKNPVIKTWHYCLYCGEKGD